MKNKNTNTVMLHYFLRVASYSILFLIVCCNESKVKRDYYANGNLKFEGETKNGKLNGVVKTYYEDGKLKSEGFYLNNKCNGINKTYYKNGKVKDIGKFINDTIDGAVIFFDENGAKIKEITMKKGVIVSSSIPLFKKKVIINPSEIPIIDVNSHFKVNLILNFIPADAKSENIFIGNKDFSTGKISIFDTINALNGKAEYFLPTNKKGNHNIQGIYKLNLFDGNAIGIPFEIKYSVR